MSYIKVSRPCRTWVDGFDLINFKKKIEWETNYYRMRYYVEQEKKKKILLYRYICWLITPCGKICRSNNQERDNKCVVQNTTEKWNIVIKHICSIKYEMDKWNLYKKGMINRIMISITSWFSLRFELLIVSVYFIWFLHLKGEIDAENRCR